MERHSTSQKVLATVVGAIILAAATVMNIAASGSDVPHGLLVAALSLGVFAGARVIGSGAGKVSIVILLAMICGEAFNFSATAERIVIEREAKAAKVNALVAKRDEALKALHDLESGKITSPRLEIAIAAAEAAKKAVSTEAANGGCKKECKRKQGLADKAEAEVREAAAEASAMHQKAIEVAKAEIKKNPLPPSGTPLADRLHVPAWVLDLIMAGLLSFGSNVLAGVLIGFGVHSGGKHDAGQSDFGASEFDARKLKIMVSGDLPPPPKSRKRKLRKLPANVVNFPNKPVVTALKNNGGSVSSNKMLSEIMGVSEGEATRRVKREKDYLDIVRVGKQTHIALKS